MSYLPRFDSMSGIFSNSGFFSYALLAPGAKCSGCYHFPHLCDFVMNCMGPFSFDMNSGDLLAFHSLVVHGSAGNISKYRRRRGYAVRYTGKDVFYCSEKGSHLDLRNPELDDGDRLDSKQYPVVWEKDKNVL